jgi:hypothetical protein
MPFLVCEQWRLDRSLFLVGIHGQHKRKTQRKLDTHFFNLFVPMGELCLHEISCIFKILIIKILNSKKLLSPKSVIFGLISAPALMKDIMRGENSYIILCISHKKHHHFMIIIFLRSAISVNTSNSNPKIFCYLSRTNSFFFKNLDLFLNCFG